MSECTLKWQEQFPDDLTISKEKGDTLTQEMIQEMIQETEEELCHLCRARPVIVYGMCNYCNEMIKNKDDRDLFPPGFNQTHEIGEPSNWPTPMYNVVDCNEVRYENFYWQSPSPAEMISTSDKESVGSCDWIVITSDED